LTTITSNPTVITQTISMIIAANPVPVFIVPQRLWQTVGKLKTTTHGKQIKFTLSLNLKAYYAAAHYAPLDNRLFAQLQGRLAQP